jgi:hypothetical protein
MRRTPSLAAGTCGASIVRWHWLRSCTHPALTAGRGLTTRSTSRTHEYPSAFLPAPSAGRSTVPHVDLLNKGQSLVATGKFTSFASRGSGAAARRRSWWTGTSAASSPTSPQTSCACLTPSRCGIWHALGIPPLCQVLAVCIYTGRHMAQAPDAFQLHINSLMITHAPHGNSII